MGGDGWGHEGQGRLTGGDARNSGSKRNDLFLWGIHGDKSENDGALVMLVHLDLFLLPHRPHPRHLPASYKHPADAQPLPSHSPPTLPKSPFLTIPSARVPVDLLARARQLAHPYLRLVLESLPCHSSSPPPPELSTAPASPKARRRTHFYTHRGAIHVHLKRHCLIIHIGIVDLLLLALLLQRVHLERKLVGLHRRALDDVHL